jgi:glycosyltransferase involved in cell wall biosynthesis
MENKYNVLFIDNSLTNNAGLNPFFKMSLENLTSSFNKIICIGKFNNKYKMEVNNYKNVIVFNVGKKEMIKKWYLTINTFFSREWFVELKRAIKNRASISSIIMAFLLSFRGMVYASYSKQLCKELKSANKGSKWVIYSYWLDSDAYAAALLKKEFPWIKAVSRAHAYEINYKRNPFVLYLMRAFILNSLDSISFISKISREFFVDSLKLSTSEIKTNLRVDYLGIKKPDRKTICKPSDDGIFRIVSCSYLVSIKRVDLIIKALSKWQGNKINWKHFGGGPLLEEMLELAHQQLDGNNNICWEITGDISNDAIHNYYSNNKIDAFISMSSTEGIPVSFMEVLSYGIPIITTNVGSISEIIDNQCGIIIDENPNIDTIITSFQSFISIGKDEKYIMRENAYKKWLDKFDQEKNWRIFYDEVIL